MEISCDFKDNSSNFNNNPAATRGSRNDGGFSTKINQLKIMTKLQNFALNGVTNSVRQGLPGQYLAGVILSYLVNSGLIAFLLYPTFLRIADKNSLLALVVVGAGALVVQYFRYLIVFTDQLVPNGVQSSRFVVRVVAFAMWLFSAVEVYHATAGIEWLSDSQFWSLVLFGWGIVTGGYVLEVSFVKKVNEITDLQVGEAYEDDEAVKERIRQEQEAQRAQGSHPTGNNRSYSPEELQAMMQQAVATALTTNSSIKNRAEMERVASEMQQINDDTKKPEDWILQEAMEQNVAFRDTIKEMQAELERLKSMQQAEASLEGVNVPLDLTAVNGNGH